MFSFCQAEKQEYIDSILKNVHFLGNKVSKKLESCLFFVDSMTIIIFQPVRVTYSSDYFQELYEFAVKLIKSGDAYVCHQTKEQVYPSQIRKCITFCDLHDLQVKASRDVLRQVIACALVLTILNPKQYVCSYLSSS